MLTTPPARSLSQAKEKTRRVIGKSLAGESLAQSPENNHKIDDLGGIFIYRTPEYHIIINNKKIQIGQLF